MKSAGSRGIEAPFTPDGVSCNSIRPHDVTFPMEAGPGTVALISRPRSSGRFSQNQQLGVLPGTDGMRPDCDSVREGLFIMQTGTQKTTQLLSAQVFSEFSRLRAAGLAFRV